MYKVLTISLLTLFLCTGWGQTENSWSKKASFGGLKREKAVAFSIGNFGYVASGVDTAEITYNDLWQYDPVLDTWTQKATMPAIERRNAIAFAIEEKGYVGTGFSLNDGDLGVKLKDFWEYDPLGNVWSAKANFPGGGDTGIYQATAFAALGKGYIACGKIGSDAYTSELWEYNPDSDNWTERTPFPGGERYQLVSFVIEDEAYVGLGTDHDVYRKDFYKYDPASNTWATIAELPGTERAQASTFSIGVKGFVIFGSDGGLKDELWEYSNYTESWNIRAAFPTSGRKYGIAFSIGNKGYAGLGKGASGKKQSFYEYAPSGPLSIESTEKIQFTTYPNPVKDKLSVRLPENNIKGKYIILNQNGQILRKEEYTTNEFIIERNQLSTGIYSLLILNENNVIIGINKMAIL